MLSSAKLFETAQNQLDHNRLFALINSLNDGFLAVDSQGTIKLSNSVALDLLDSNTLEGKNITQVMVLTDKNGSSVDAYQLIKNSKNSLTSRDFSLKIGDQALVNVYLSVATVRGGFGKEAEAGYVVIIRDITRDKTKEDERDEFISVASHELRTPVTIAEGGISNALLLAERGQLPDTIIQSLKSSHEQMLFLMSLINDLALLSRADGGRSSLLLEEIKLADTMAELVSNYQPQAAKKGLQLTLNNSGPPSLYSSKLYFKEILQNLVINAIKYTEKGTININVRPDADKIHFEIADSGIGIDKGEQPKLFTKFFRSEDSRVRQISGTGLGLYISAKLAKLLGGEISVVSELNAGSRFTLSLPTSIYHAPAKTPEAVA